MEEQTAYVTKPPPERWAIVHLMGHAQTAGRIGQSEFGGLLRVDVPVTGAEAVSQQQAVEDVPLFRTEEYGPSAIYSIQYVSEEIARAHAPTADFVSSYDTPVVHIDDHRRAVQKQREENSRLRAQNEQLRHRLTAIEADDVPRLSEPENDSLF